MCTLTYWHLACGHPSHQMDFCKHKQTSEAGVTYSCVNLKSRHEVDSKDAPSCPEESCVYDGRAWVCCSCRQPNTPPDAICFNLKEMSSQACGHSRCSACTVDSGGRFSS